MMTRTIPLVRHRVAATCALAVVAFGLVNAATPDTPGSAPEGMAWIPGGEFAMGSEASSEGLCGLPGVTRDSQPVHRVSVDGFWMDKTDVTNEQFEKFVKATHYVTVAEHAPS